MSKDRETATNGDDAAAETAVRLKHLALVADYGLFALRQADIEVVLHRACEAAAEGLNTRLAKILHYRPQRRDLLLVHGVGWREGVVGHATVGSDRDSPAGYAVHTRLPVMSGLLSDETRFKTPAVLGEHGVHRAIDVLIGTDGGEPYGVLEADSTDRDAFTGEDLAFLQALAHVASAALQRQRQAETQANSLRDKDLLMQEVHHRTKNSLQIVHTMLHLQARSLADAAERDRLNDAACRIMTIAAVHRQLHEEASLEQVDLSSYLPGLLADVARSLCPADGSRPFAIEVDSIRLPAQQATPIGLIAVELVTNALKYGLGATTVTVRQSGANVTVTATDQGGGFPPEFDPAASRSLGMRLIMALARKPDAITVQRKAALNTISVDVVLPKAPTRSQHHAAEDTLR